MHYILKGRRLKFVAIVYLVKLISCKSTFLDTIGAHLQKPATAGSDRKRKYGNLLSFSDPDHHNLLVWRMGIPRLQIPSKTVGHIAPDS